MVMIAGLFALLYRHALRRAAEIGLDAGELLATRMQVAIWSSMATLAALSTLTAALLPFRVDQPFVFTLPGVLYALTSIFAPAIRHHYTKRIVLLPT